MPAANAAKYFVASGTMRVISIPGICALELLNFLVGELRIIHHIVDIDARRTGRRGCAAAPAAGACAPGAAGAQATSTPPAAETPTKRMNARRLKRPLLIQLIFHWFLLWFNLAHKFKQHRPIGFGMFTERMRLLIRLGTEWALNIDKPRAGKMITSFAQSVNRQNDAT